MTILSALVARYNQMAARDEVPIPGYSTEKISFGITLTPDGQVVGVVPLGEIVKGKHVPRSMTVPQIPPGRTSGVRACLFWDKTAYAMGITDPTKESRRAKKKGLRPGQEEFQEFRKRQREAIGENPDRGLKALLAFLDRWDETQFVALPHAQEMVDTNVVFRLDGLNEPWLHDRLAAREIIRTALSSGLRGTAVERTCLVTGVNAPIALTHDPKIKGVRGAQSSGASIVSFNQDSFKSYGKEKGENAPVSEAAAFAYTTALNALLANSRRCVQIGDATVAFWSEAEGEADESAAEQAADLFAVALGADSDTSSEVVESAVEEDILADLSAIAKGQPVPGIGNRAIDPDTRFYILALSPSKARISIRFWLETTFGKLADQLGRHYEDLRLEPSGWKIAPSLWRLVFALAPIRRSADGRIARLSQDERERFIKSYAHLAGEFARAALTGNPYPASLLTLTLSRLRADHQVTGLRAAMIKATLKRRNEEVPVSLAKDEPNAGYRLGRLFAVLESLQVAGVGKVNAGIRDRYIGAASATPARVFPMLLRGAQNHHSAALKKKGWEPGRAVKLEREIRQIMDGLPAHEPFPATLELDDQGRFFVGYYQQQADFFAGHGDMPDAADPADISDAEETSDD